MMHELLFTFAIEKLGRIGLPGPALSPAMMMLCGQNQQLPLPGTVQSKTYSLPPWEISATRHMAGLLTMQSRAKEEDQRTLYKDDAVRNHIREAKSTGRNIPLPYFPVDGTRLEVRGKYLSCIAQGVPACTYKEQRIRLLQARQCMCPCTSPGDLKCCTRAMGIEHY